MVETKWEDSPSNVRGCVKFSNPDEGFMNRLLRGLVLYTGRGAGHCLSGRIENVACIYHPGPHAHTQLSQSLKFLPLALLLLVEAEGFKKTLVQI